MNEFHFCVEDLYIDMERKKELSVTPVADVDGTNITKYTWIQKDNITNDCFRYKLFR